MLNNNPVYCVQSTHPRAHALYMLDLDPLRSDHALSTGILLSDVSNHAYMYPAHRMYRPHFSIPPYNVPHSGSGKRSADPLTVDVHLLLPSSAVHECTALVPRYTYFGMQISEERP